jgi:hypothetical protein
MAKPLQWLCASCLFLSAAEAAAQRSENDPRTNASAAMASLRAQGHPGAAGRVLRQYLGPIDRQTLDELADSLTQFVIEAAPREATRDAAGKALDAIAFAAGASGEGTPYEGAGSRLMQIAQADVPIAGAALYWLTTLPNKQEAVERLSVVARSPADGAVAYTAISLLYDLMGPDGLAEIRRLYISGQVTNLTARSQVEAFAQLHRW